VGRSYTGHGLIPKRKNVRGPPILICADVEGAGLIEAASKSLEADFEEVEGYTSQTLIDALLVVKSMLITVGDNKLINFF